MQNNTKKFLGVVLTCLATSACGGATPTPNVPIDKSKFPNYIEDVDSIVYDYNDVTRIQPFWKGNIIYNETVLLRKDESTGEVSGNLMFKPVKVLAVKDYTLKTIDYQPNSDYKIEGNKIIRIEGSRIPYLTEANLKGEDIPEGYRLVNSIENVKTDIVNFGATLYTESPFYYGNQIQVSYVYDVRDIVNDLDKYPTYDSIKLLRLQDKIAKGETIKILGQGDSVMFGCSTSKTFDHEPYMDTFIELTRKEMERRNNASVILENIAVGGKESSWGSSDEQIRKIIDNNPDVVFLHFGINDLGSKISKNIYYEQMQKIILNVRVKLPAVEFVLLSPFAPHQDMYDYVKMNEYVEKLYQLEKENNGVKVIDMFNLSKEMIKNKDYYDMTGNGVNHPNDFAARSYVEAIISTIYNK